MGYTTYFTGELKLSKEPTQKQFEFINNFSGCRRMGRNIDELMKQFNGKYGLPNPKGKTALDIYGEDGIYCTNDDNCYGGSNPTIIDHNTPPGQVLYSSKEYGDIYKENERRIEAGECQPGLWCQWILEYDADSHILVWNGGEKFYEYTNWLKYLIKHFFEPWGIKLNGEIEWDGEDPEDLGKIVVEDNVVKEKRGRIIYD